MNVTLTPQLQRFVAHKIKDGSYKTAAAVIQEALRLLEQRDQMAMATPALQGSDIDALVQTVLLQAARDADEDLREIMRELQSINAAKRKLRELIQRVRHDRANNAGRLRLEYDAQGLGSERAYHRAPMPVADPEATGRVRFVQIDLHPGRITAVESFDSILADLQDQRDSLADLSEMNSLRLQILMDRRSKLYTALSNILKKLSDTEDAIVHNLK
jgi:putative addiction module CopG family antidote